MNITKKFKMYGIMLSALCLIGFTPTQSAALDDAGSLRCNSETVMTGDNQFRVKEACGEPDSIQVRAVGKEVWIYNFGSTRLIHYLDFNRGRLERIQVGEVGD